MTNGGLGRTTWGRGVRTPVLPVRSSPRSELSTLSGKIPVLTGDQPLMVEDVIGKRRLAPIAIEVEPLIVTPRRGLGDDRIRDLTPARPEELVTVRMSGKSPIQLTRPTAEALARLVSEARAAGIAAGPLLDVMSGYRSDEQQAKKWQAALEKYETEKAAGRWVAPPGRSMHRTGRAVDLNLGLPIGSEYAKAQRGLAIYKWLQWNAPRLGFFPYAREPWHWEYNPNYFTEHTRPEWPQSPSTLGYTPPSYTPSVSLAGQPTVQQSRPDYFTEHTRPEWPQSPSTLGYTPPSYTPSVSLAGQPIVQQSRPGYFTEHTRPEWPQSRR